MAPKLYLIYLSAPCRAVLMVAKAIGVELEIEELEKEQLKSPEILEVNNWRVYESQMNIDLIFLTVQINPQHTVPILVDDDFTIWDSHAIAGYLIGQYAEGDSLYPKDDVKKRALVDQRLHFENGVLFERCKAAAVSI